MKNIQNNIALINDLIKKYSNCISSYDDIVQVSKNVIFSKNRKPSSLYGMYVPDNKIKVLTGDYYGKIIKREENRDFKYYFDSNNRIIMTERYSNGILLDIIFYFYYEKNIDIVRYLVKKNIIINIARIDYIGGEISKFIESYDLRLGEINYKELIFNNNDNTIVQLNNFYFNVKKEQVFLTKCIQVKK